MFGLVLLRSCWRRPLPEGGSAGFDPRSSVPRRPSGIQSDLASPRWRISRRRPAYLAAFGSLVASLLGAVVGLVVGGIAVLRCDCWPLTHVRDATTARSGASRAGRPPHSAQRHDRWPSAPRAAAALLCGDRHRDRAAVIACSPPGTAVSAVGRPRLVALWTRGSVVGDGGDHLPGGIAGGALAGGSDGSSCSSSPAGQILMGLARLPAPDAARRRARAAGRRLRVDPIVDSASPPSTAPG